MIPLIAFALLAAAAPDESGYPGPLKEFLAAKNKDGTPVLSAEDRKALAALPEHTRKLLGDAADSVILGSASHLKVLLSLELAPSAMELVAQDNCILCHSDPGNQKGKTLFAADPEARKSNPLLNLKEFVSDVHFRRGLSCAGCHGGKPSDEMMTKEIAARWPSEEARHRDRSWIPGFCARCHADPAFMRGFNPTLPTDQLAKYKSSLHGIRLLQEKDSRAAQCVSCHGVHGIRNAKSRKSMVHAQRIPDTCGACHADPKHMQGYKLANGAPFPTGMVAEYKSSVHGKALLEKGDLGAPACTGCHGSHAAMPPAVASVAQVCRRCHAQNGMLFDGSRHKQAFEEHKWPECGQCHGKHGIAKASDALVGDAPGTLCQDCHSVYAKKNPQCNATAAVFRSSLDKLAEGRAEVADQVEKLAERGLDVEPLSRTVADLDEALVQSRSKIHSFDESTFQSAAQPGNEALAKSRELIADSRHEVRFRTRGLLAAIGFMSLIAVGIALKLREIGRKRED
ncbi:MAG TPA: cytochrome c3 family protein [Myxococcales bacterium]|nr:cytochrome c3 family protein [Myxococcales bacterium]